MSLAWELEGSSKRLNTSCINDALQNHNVEEIAQFIRSSDIIEGLTLYEPLVNEELGRHVSDAIVYNTHIRELFFYNERVAIRDLVAWIASCDTLVHMTSLQRVSLRLYHDMSALDGSTLFPLLLTSTSLHLFEIIFTQNSNGCIDDVMSALVSYLGAASLREFEFSSCGLSDAAFTALCDGVASSTLQKFTLSSLFEEFNLEPAAESLARMIVQSSLEEIRIQRYFEWATSWEVRCIWSERFISALQRTTPVQNLDFTFTQIGNAPTTHLRINRKWKPLVSANTPLALRPHILKKSFTF
jgi:hypothetical protein